MHDDLSPGQLVTIATGKWPIYKWPIYVSRARDFGRANQGEVMLIIQKAPNNKLILMSAEFDCLFWLYADQVVKI